MGTSINHDETRKDENAVFETKPAACYTKKKTEGPAKTQNQSHSTSYHTRGWLFEDKGVRRKRLELA